jgi:hypothetical protein
MKDKCYMCGVVREGKLHTVDVDEKHGRVYKEFICNVCFYQNDEGGELDAD